MDRVNATPADWHHWACFGLRSHLMPIVTDPAAQPSPQSAVKQFGKIPSIYDRRGRASGIRNWTARDFSTGISTNYRHDPRYGIGLRTGCSSGVYALDCDLQMSGASLRARQLIEEAFAPVRPPLRLRSNAYKFLVPLRIEHKPALSKRVIKHHDDRIEFLANGQQFVCCGYHPSGVLYEWRGGLPAEIPELTLEEFERLWTTLREQFETEPQPTHRESQGNVTVSSDDASHESLRTTIDAATLEDLKDALRWPPLVAKAADNSYWSEIGYALLSLGRPVGYDLWIDFSKRAPNYELGAPEAWWEAHE